MILGLQAHAKLILNSAALRAWTLKAPYPRENGPRRLMFNAVLNKPSDVLDEYDIESEGMNYLTEFEDIFTKTPFRLQRLWAVEFAGLETIDYRAIERRAEMNGLSHRKVAIGKQVCLLLELLDLASKTPHTLRHDIDWLPHLTQLELLKSMIILSTFLVESYGHSDACEVLIRMFCSFRNFGWPIHNGVEVDWPHNISVWSTVGQIAGFQKVAERVLNSRLQKWGTTKAHPRIPPCWDDFVVTRQLLHWINDQTVKDPFIFDIRGIDSIRARLALDYALVEFLIEFGFPLCPPVIIIDSKWGLQAQVEKKTQGENYLISTREQEYAQYLQMAEENRHPSSRGRAFSPFTS
jgi:hypothetical protein